MKKLLLLGPEVTDFLNPLAGKLKEQGYVVDVLEIRKTPRIIHHTQVYSAILDYQKIIEKKITVADIIKYLFKTELYKNIFKMFNINCIERKCRIVKCLKYSLNYQHMKERIAPVLKNYDIINFHSLTPALLSLVDFVGKETKIILSYWGSDLFQIWGWDSPVQESIKDFYIESKAMKRADIITVPSYEMERAVSAKFGQEIKKKVVRALFGMSDKIFEVIDESRQNYPDSEFMKNYRIPENKINITIGYCGDPICNHLPVFSEIEKIAGKTKEKMHLLVPMTYGNYSDEYMAEVKRMLNSAGISYTLFDKFLSLKELGKLRLTSDIMIMMNKSDALSVSVCESIYADNLLISALWLPYSPLRAGKIFFYETDFSNLSEIISYSVDNYDQIKVKLRGNPEKIKRLNGLNNTWQKWNRMLNSLFTSSTIN